MRVNNQCCSAQRYDNSTLFLLKYAFKELNLCNILEEKRSLFTEKCIFAAAKALHCMKSQLSSLLLCLLIPILTSAQSRKWLQLPNLEQLPSQRVLFLMQDSEGVLWYATEGGGICRDDGRQVDIFRNDAHHPDLLGSNNVACLAEAGRHLIIGTFHGACVLDKHSFHIRRLEEVDDHRVDDILVRRNGQVLLTTNHKVYEFSESMKLLHTYSSRWQGQEKYVAHLYEDRNGWIWATQWDGGLLCLKDGQMTEAPWPLPVAPTDLVDAEEDGTMWIGTVGQGIVRYHVADGQVQHQPATSGAVCIDLQPTADSSSLWIATMNDLQLFRADSVLTPQPAADYVPSGTKVLHRLSLDLHGHLLVAGSEPGPFVVLQGEQRPWFDNSIHEGNILWQYRERRGVVMQDATGERVVDVGRQLLPSLAKRSGQDGIWATDGQRLYSLTADSIHEQTTFTTRPLAMVDDGRGGLWFTTGSEIRRLDLNSGAEEQVLGQPDISALAFTPDSTLWLASIYGKIFAYRDGKLTQDRYASNEQGDAITHLALDSLGRLFIVSDRYIHLYDPTLRTLRQQSREAAGVYAIELQETVPEEYWNRPRNKPTSLLSKWLATWRPWALAAIILLGIILLLIWKKSSHKTIPSNRLLRPESEALSALESTRSEEEDEQATSEDSADEATAGSSSTEESTPSAARKEQRIKTKFLRAATKQVEAHLSEDTYSVEQLSSDLCMSRMTFYRKIQAATGQKPTEFMRTIRLRHAAKLLSEGHLTITEISYETGFTSVSYFSRCFRKMYGIPPTQFATDDGKATNLEAPANGTTPS